VNYKEYEESQISKSFLKREGGPQSRVEKEKGAVGVKSHMDQGNSRRRKDRRIILIRKRQGKGGVKVRKKGGAFKGGSRRLHEGGLALMGQRKGKKRRNRPRSLKGRGGGGKTPKQQSKRQGPNENKIPQETATPQKREKNAKG